MPHAEITTPDAAPTPPPAWADMLAPGDVVVTRLAVPGGHGRPELRPALVLDVERLGDKRMVLLACGVPAAGRPARGLDLHATEEDLRGVRGVRGPLVFAAARRLMMPLAQGCAASGGDGTASPVLGRLGEGALRRVHQVRARLRAERDGTAERRRERRTRRGPAVRGRDFVVERRHPPGRGPGRPTPGRRTGREGQA